MMLDPAMIHWNPNPEMFPNQPVGLPTRPVNFQADPGLRIAIDPIHAFEPQAPSITSVPPAAIPPVPTNVVPTYTPPQITSSNAGAPPRTFAPSFGPMQNLALQMGQYGAPSGYRSPSQMGVTPYNPALTGSPGAYDGSDVNRPPTDNIPPIQGPNPVAPPGMGGGGIPNNNTWINDLSGYVNWATGNNPMFPTPVGSNPFSGLNIGGALNAVGSGLNAIVNPIGAIIGAITNQEPEEETADHSQPPASTGSTATGGSPYIPWLGNEGPSVINDTNNNPIGNVNNEVIDQIIRQIIPRFSTPSFTDLMGR